MDPLVFRYRNICTAESLRTSARERVSSDFILRLLGHSPSCWLQRVLYVITSPRRWCGRDPWSDGEHRTLLSLRLSSMFRRGLILTDSRTCMHRHISVRVLRGIGQVTDRFATDPSQRRPSAVSGHWRQCSYVERMTGSRHGDKP